MGKTTASKAAGGSGRKRGATAKVATGRAQSPARRDTAAARFAELKRRIRAMADPSPAPPATASRGSTQPARSKIAAASRQSSTSRRSDTRRPARRKPESRKPASRKSVEAQLAELKHRLLEASDIASAAAVLGWDQQTYMPKGGAAARGRQGATLSRLAHERLTDPAVGRLLDNLAAYADGLPEDADDACLIRVARRDYDRAVKLPAEFIAHWKELGAASYNAWTRARPANDFAAMRPYLERALDYSRRCANYLGPYDHIADPLIGGADDGMTAASVRALFDQLRAELVPIVRAISEQETADDSCLRGHFPEPRQLKLGFEIIQRFGYDLDRGRLDKTHHPFCTKFAPGDVRITTRVKENDISEALFSTLHEAGHALYEQGVDPELEGTRLGSGASAGVHESQSRLWENVVGRSRGFWEHFYPRLADAFPDPFKAVPLETFHRAINKVARSLIRTDADEVTYNLHVMLRFDLELELLEGRLAVKDLPEAWRARFEADFGLTPADDRDGCLQDVHWYAGTIGGRFQGYTIGNILSAQFYDAAVAAHPEIPQAIRRGELGTLHHWLRENLYRHGRKHQPDVIVRRATGSQMSIEPYMRYLRSKYGALYTLPAAKGGRRKQRA
ncbi:MAG TPA: carboxypeptidase M32 [Hyphomicrobiaceae bacterium]|nr:carboxypeptidase M32 [Hyphomicrobiaceae bacterium]